MSEAQFHNAVASYLSGILDPHVFWTTFPAGGGGRFRGAQLKRAGLRAGVPDILLFAEGRAYGIELKAPKGSVSGEQKACHMDMAIAGVPVAVVRTLHDVMVLLKRWNIPTRIAA